MLVGPASFLHAGQNLHAQGSSLSLGTQIRDGYPEMKIPPEMLIFFYWVFLGLIKIRLKSIHLHMESIERNIPQSKYLKAAQQLLDEVANVGKALKQPYSEKNQNIHELWKGSKEADGGSKNGTGRPPASSNPQEPVSNSSSELSPAERQDLQNKMTKLLAMLDEVRLWKPMVEEMYKEEISDADIDDSNSSSEYVAPKVTKDDNDVKTRRVSEERCDDFHISMRRCTYNPAFWVILMN